MERNTSVMHEDSFSDVTFFASSPFYTTFYKIRLFRKILAIGLSCVWQSGFAEQMSVGLLRGMNLNYYYSEPSKTPK